MCLLWELHNAINTVYFILFYIYLRCRCAACGTTVLLLGLHGTWHMAHGTWHMAHGTWHMAHGTWHMAYLLVHLSMISLHLECIVNCVVMLHSINLAASIFK